MYFKEGGGKYQVIVVLWAWIRAPATHFLGARILASLTISTPPAAFGAPPQYLPSPFSVIVLSSQYLFQRGPLKDSWLFTHINGYSDQMTSWQSVLIRCDKTYIIVSRFAHELNWYRQGIVLAPLQEGQICCTIRMLSSKEGTKL